MVKALIFGAIALCMLIYGMIEGFKSGTKGTLKNILIHFICVVVSIICAVAIHKFAPITFGIVFDTQNGSIWLTKVIPQNIIEICGKIIFVQHYNALVLFILYMLFYNIARQFVHIRKKASYFEDEITVISKIGGMLLSIVNCILAYIVVAMLVTQTVLGICL